MSGPAGGIPQLTIPITINGVTAHAELDKLLQKGKESTGGIADGAKAASQEMGGLSSAAGQVVERFAGIATVGAGLSAVVGTANQLAQGFNHAAQELRQMADDFLRFRRLTADLAGVQGVAPSNQFTAGLVTQAEAAGLSPTRLAGFQQAMTEQIAGNIGEGRQLSQTQADTITSKTAQFGVARGISPEGISQLIGGLTRSTKAGPDADKQVLERFGKLINLMDASPGKVEALLPELTEVMATGASPEEAGALTSVMAARGRPRESGTYGRAAQRAVTDILQRKLAGKGEDFGITENDTASQAAEKVYAAAQKEGVNFGNPTAVGLWLAGKGITAVEQQDALTAMFNIGIRGQGLANARGTIAAGGIGAIDASVARFTGSDEGRQQAAEAQTEIARFRQGQRLSAWALAQEQAKAELTPDLARYGGDRLARDVLGSTPFFGQMFGDSGTQMVTRRALTKIEDQARAAGVPENEMTMRGAPAVGFAAAQSQAERLLERIAENTRPGSPPLSAPMPPSGSEIKRP